MSGSQLNRDTTSEFGITDRVLLEKYGFQIVNSKKINPLISDTDNTSNAFIHQGRLTVDAGQTKLIDAMKSYHFEDGTRKKLVKYNDQFAFIDGLGDCLRYGIHHLFPIMHDEGMQQDYITDDTRFHRRPGGQHMPNSPLYVGGPTWEELLSPNGAEDTTSEDHQVW